MPFEPKTAQCPGAVRAVTIGTGKRACTVGGRRAYPFYTFDAETACKPGIGFDLPDTVQDDTPEEEAFFAGCDTLADRARRVTESGIADFLCLHFVSADPGGENRDAADCVKDAVAVSEATDLPLAIMGCRNLAKDSEIFSGIAKALKGKNVLFLSAREEDHTDAARVTVTENGHTLCAETADDINLAKQLSILLRTDGVPDEKTVMNIGTASVGYGYEYMLSTLDRVQDGALRMCDPDLSAPIIAPVSTETRPVKESAATEAEAPEWGPQEDRVVAMEITTAAANLVSGADAVILRHPRAIRGIRNFISGLL